MKQEFEAQAYDAACMIMGEAVWQLVAAGEPVTQERIATMVVELSEHRTDLADSIALSVLSHHDPVLSSTFAGAK